MNPPKKLGRPTTNPKTKSTRIRLTDDQDRKLDECSKKLNLTRTEVLLLGLDKVYQTL